MNDQELRKVQLLQLKLLKEFDRVCNRHGIRYYLSNGTLLGAVRHKGFIPWDDDLDVSMLREDYEKFLAVAANELGGEYLLQNDSVDPSFAVKYSKLRLKNTVFREATSPEGFLSHGIFIDIFPLDNFPARGGRRVGKRMRFLRRVWMSKCGYRLTARDAGPLKSLFYAGIRFISLFYTKKGLSRKLSDLLERHNGEPCAYVCELSSGFENLIEELTVPREWVERTVPLPFEDGLFPVPAEYDAFLTHQYGDYMTPPPEEKRRNRHGIERLDFGPYGDDL